MTTQKVEVIEPRVLPLGRTVATRAVHDWMFAGGMARSSLSLARHERCDWGSVCETDRKSNDAALVNGDRVLSVYDTGDKSHPALWILTEADRSATTLLFPEDY